MAVPRGKNSVRLVVKEGAILKDLAGAE